jgi:hypothetical protein
MPTLSASDYTQYLKFKAAAASPIKPAIQTRDNATLSQSVLNANILASQAAFVVTPTLQVIGDLARVPGRPVVQQRSNPNALSTLSWTAGSSGSVGSLSSSRVNVPGGLPTGFKGSQGTYTRLPQNAGWVQGGAASVSSGPKRF